MFNKIIVLYSAVMMLLFGIAAVLVYQYQTQRILREYTDANLKSAHVLSMYLNRQYEGVMSMLQQIYGDAALSDELTFFLNHDYESYLKYRLDLYSRTGERPRSFTALIKNYLEQEPGVKSITVYSSTQNFDMFFSKSRQMLDNETVSQHYAPPFNLLEPQSWDSKKEGNQEVYSYSRELKDPWTLEQIGIINVEFDRKQISAWLENRASMRGRLVALTPQGETIFDSEGEGSRSGSVHRMDLNHGDKRVQPDESSKATVLQVGNSGLSVAAMVPKSSIQLNTKHLKLSLAAITLLFIAASFAVTFSVIRKYSKKVQRIIRSMNRIGEGDLSTRIHMPGEDELQQIAARFNDMGDRLEQYIDQMYTSELKQKQAELVALQSQINPHFLYNTLESIRMKAYVQGARETGQMIYSLSVLFKNMVKQSTIVTLGEELEMCRVYLELLRIRYEGRLVTQIELEPEIRDCPMIKLLVQPVVENYFVHGFRSSEEDNRICVTARREQEYILITVTDNGTGISPSRLEEIRRTLDGAAASGVDKVYASIGLMNVHERIVLNYGPGYGLTIASQEGRGTEVCLKIPMLKGETT